VTFSASYDRVTKSISALVCLFLLAVMAATHSLVFCVLAVLLILVSYAYSPRGYVIADRSIAVQRLAGRPRIALDDVRELRRATPDDSSGAIRLWGSGGLFGYYGLFSSAKLGKFTAYVINRNNKVLVVSGSKTVLFSPDDVAGFLNAIRAFAPVPSGPAQTEVNAGK
jgi:Bacterial PH domain